MTDYEKGYKDGMASAALPNVIDNGDKIDGYAYSYKTDSDGVPYINIDCVRNMLDKAADVQPINRWIKADESLPVYSGMVLICDKSKNIRLGIYTDMGWCSQFGNPMMCKITHWQPLPEPPKDGDTE